VTLTPCHQARNHGGAGEIDNLSAGRSVHGRTHRGNAAVIEHQGLILNRGGAGAIDHANMPQRDDRRVDADKRLDPRSELVLGHQGDNETRQKPLQGFGT